MILLAQGGSLPPPSDYAAVGWVVVILAGLMVMLRTAIGLWRDLTKPGGAEKREVTIAGGVASKEELDKLARQEAHEVEKLWSKVGGVERGVMEKVNTEIKGLREERRQDMRQLHEEVNGVGRKVSGLEATNVLQNQRLSEISAKLDRVIEKQHGREE